MASSDYGHFAGVCAALQAAVEEIGKRMSDPDRVKVAAEMMEFASSRRNAAGDPAYVAAVVDISEQIAKAIMVEEVG